MGFGCYNPFPLQFGGGIRPIEVQHQALNESDARVFDVSEGSIKDVENYAQASLLAMVWEANGRAAGQFQPLKMQEALPDFEQACRLTPSADDPLPERRAALAAKFRGYTGNAESDVRDVCLALMGPNFVQTSYVEPSENVLYWAGENPGPPGMEWFSKDEIVFVEVNKNGLTQEDFDRKVAKLAATLDDLIPSWMTFEIYTVDTNGTDDGFILDFSSLDEVGL